MGLFCLSFFFFQAEDGIRDRDVTGVQTCALPISVIITTSMAGSTYLSRSRTSMPDMPAMRMSHTATSTLCCCASLIAVGPLSAWSKDRKSTRLNSSHITISYAVFCLKKKNVNQSRMVGTIANEILHSKARYVVVTMCIDRVQGASGLFEDSN